MGFPRDPFHFLKYGPCTDIHCADHPNEALKTMVAALIPKVDMLLDMLSSYLKTQVNSQLEVDKAKDIT